MRPSTLDQLALRHGIQVPPLATSASTRTWAAFQAQYDAARATIRRPADVTRVITEAAEDDAADGCGWLEIQIDPTSYAPVLGGLRQTIETVLAAAAQAPIPVGVIIASSWARPAEHAEKLARLAAASAGAGVVGFGLSNDERAGDPAGFTTAAGIAADAGLLVTPHSGFYTGAEHVRACVEELGATRIGHGTAAARDPEVLKLLADRNIAAEVCPTSYPPFGVHELSEVPVRALLEAGVPVAIGSDDPLLFGTSLAGQYALCRDALGLSDRDLAELARHSIGCSSAPRELKAALLTGVEAWLRPSAGLAPGPRDVPAR
jgi:adenosine deaminase